MHIIIGYIQSWFIHLFGGYTWAEYEIYGGDCYRAGWDRKESDYANPEEHEANKRWLQRNYPEFQNEES